MKKLYIMGIILSLILLVFLNGCTTTTMDENVKAGIEMATKDRSDVYDWVQTGMTQQQIREKFGEPTKIQQMESDIGPMMEGIEDLGIDVESTKMKLEYWYYGNVQIGFTNGKVTTKIKI